MEVIVGRKGNQPFPISDQMVSRRHVKITKNAEGKIMIEDLDSSHGTFVDGMQVKMKVVTPDTIVRLGETFKFRVGDAMKETKISDGGGIPAGGGVKMPQDPVKKPHGGGTPPAPPQKELSIRHLQAVWDEYDALNDEVDEKAKNLAMMRSIPVAFTMGAGVLSIFLGPVCWGLTAIGFLLSLFGIYKQKQFDAKKEKKEIQRDFESKYVCPGCNRFVGNKKYSLLIQDIGCTRQDCRCKWTH